MNKPAAIYARVSSDRQKENHTIASQTATLIEYAGIHGYTVPPEWIFQDEGYSGASLVRPGLELLRDLAAEGQIAAVLIYSAQSQVCVSGFAGRGAIALRRRGDLSEVTSGSDAGRSPGGAIPRHDCRV